MRRIVAATLQLKASAPTNTSAAFAAAGRNCIQKRVLQPRHEPVMHDVDGVGVGAETVKKLDALGKEVNKEAQKTEA